MTDPKHGPLPWKVVPAKDLPPAVIEDNAMGLGICEMLGLDAQAYADAELIVRAVNSHEALLEALRLVAALPGFEAEEPYGVAVLAAIAKAEGE